MRLDRTSQLAILRLQLGRANAMSPAFLDHLAGFLDELIATPPPALVITGHESIFSAGLDLPSLIDLDRGEIRAFMQRFEALMQRVFLLPFPVVAAINGHAIAGGTVLALQADVRLCTDGPAKLGLNEAAIGIGLPPVVLETLRAQVPASSLLPIALEGRLFSPAEAHALGLVHEVLPAAELEARALERARQLATINAPAYAYIKAALRAPVVAAAAHALAGVEPWVDTWFSPGAQERLRAAVARLRK